MSNTVKTINPATEQTIDTYTLLSQHEAEQVIEKSHETYLKWRLTSFSERAKHLNALATLFEEQKEAIAKLMTEEMGKVLSLIHI